MTYLTLANSILNLVYLDLAKPLNLEKSTTSCRVNRLPRLSAYCLLTWITVSHRNRVVAVSFELRDVNRTDAVGLNSIDVDNEAVLYKQSAYRR
jgi:hypothetical protein